MCTDGKEKRRCFLFFLKNFAGTTVRVAKRKDWIDLENDDQYFDCSGVLNKYEEKLKSLRKFFKCDALLYVYGELYGGEGDNAIQNEIIYGKEVDFVVFDVGFEKDGRLEFHSHCDVMEGCKSAGIPVLCPLYKGPLNKCMSFDVEGVRSDLAKINGRDSMIEGVVIKCSTEEKIEDSKGRPCRPVAKNKAKKFLEVCKNPVKSGNEETALKAYVTRNRLLNVISKVGKIKNKKDKKIIERLKKDLLSDVIEEATNDEDPLLVKFIQNKKVEEILKNDIEKVVENWSKE